MSEFKLTLPQICDLTPRQIHDVYFHPRDKDGAINGPAAPQAADPRIKLLQLLALAPALGIKPEKVEEIKRRLESLNNGAQQQ
ncbi:hypothetical protein VT84_14090 [Gemmata sp. SH-PL17]|uniref:hypothetical protein n=1 Tax=Gemmata sp. SH-PL17 TaxID=1630693 RepID=UPI00078E327D|nr:hypothetical protein [Gemmata sp. SH-PL17]AMV25524.1 hypothetical protein VT84_14090 [Gemmata sp. SH-PL17]